MKSALVITVGGGTEDADYIISWLHLIAVTRSLSNVMKQDCKILLQHSLRNDRMVVSVETGQQTFVGSGPSFETAINEVTEAMRTGRREYEKLLAEKKSPTGKESRKGHGRKSSSRKRLKSVR